MDEFTILISVIVSQVKHMSKIIKLYNLIIGSFVIRKLYFNKTVKQKGNWYWMFQITTCFLVDNSLQPCKEH